MSICFHDRILHVAGGTEVECEFCQEVFENENQWQTAITHAEEQHSLYEHPFE